MHRGFDDRNNNEKETILLFLIYVIIIILIMHLFVFDFRILVPLIILIRSFLGVLFHLKGRMYNRLSTRSEPHR